MHLLPKLICIGFILIPSTAETIESYRLPIHIRPINYNLNITADPKNEYFFGKAEIQVEVENGTASAVFLHADGDYITVKNVTKDGVNCSFSKPNINTHIFTVKCSTEFRSGDTVVILYQATFSTTDLNGLYKSTYDNGTLLAATLLQPVFARRVFPCFDEPSFKATYEITIVHPSRYNVLANMPLEVAIKRRNVTISQFQKTPRMATYIVAFIISEFEPALKGDPQFNVFARPSAAENMAVAKKYGELLFDSMSQWTGIRYEDLGNPQAYLVAIPDFSEGAMENWGLITFRESDLLDDGNQTENIYFQNILSVMAHEIAHQWFGNYVTLNWWSNTWLNEGFATYFSTVIVDMIDNGNLEQEKQFVTEELHIMLQKDAALSSPPLSSPENTINSPLEAISKFDLVAYYKGACIVRMMKFILGDDSFKQGLKIYLTQNKYKNANPETLLKSLQAAAGKQLTHFELKMHNWIYKSGFPLLMVAQTNESTVAITQKRFLNDKNSSTDDQWYVPLSYTNERVKDFSAHIKGWLQPNKTYQITHYEENWLILNLQESGFYRVNYDNTLWNNIIRALHSDEQRELIHPLNRAQLVDDILHIAKVGIIHYEKAFDLVNYLKKETSFYPWSSALKEFSYLLDIVDDETVKLLKQFIRNIITEAFPRKTKYTIHVDKIKESTIYSWKCKLGDKECVSFARRQFQAFKKKSSNLNIPKRSIVLCYGLKNSDNLLQDYNFLVDMLKNTQPAEQILLALGCMEDENFLTRYLNLTLLPNSPIRQQDFQVAFNSVYYRNKIGVKVALDFLEKNLNNMEKAYGGGLVLISLLTDFAGKLSSPQQIAQMKRIFNDNKEKEIVKLSETPVLEIMNTNRQWNIQYEVEFKSILKKQNGGGLSTFSINYYSVYACLLLIFTSKYTVL